jgi:hypothetical protein
MWHRSTRSLGASSRLAHLMRKTRQARRSRPELVPTLVEPLEPRLMLSAPAAPVITANPFDSTVMVSWAAVSGASTYNIYRSTQSGQETLDVSAWPNAGWTDTQLANGTSYYYQVTAVNSSSQESVKSNEASFIPQATNTIGPSNVLVIYNEDWAGDQDANGVQDSLEVAQYYAQVHGVPAQNILGIHGGPAALQSSWNTWSSNPYTAFYNNMVTPVVNTLNQLGPNNIDVLLFCYGINDLAPTANTSPSGVSLDDAMATPYRFTATSGIPEYSNPYMDVAPGFDASPGHFNHNFVAGSGVGLTARPVGCPGTDRPGPIWPEISLPRLRLLQRHGLCG